MTKEIVELGSAANTRVYSKGKNKRLVIHGRGKLEIRMIRARCPDRAETGKANDQVENFANSRNKAGERQSKRTYRWNPRSNGWPWKATQGSQTKTTEGRSTGN